jgi:predicted nucleic acid-binding Zn ribbon protein
MAAATGMSQSVVSRIWRMFGLKPHLVQTWKLGTDLQVAELVSRKLRRSAHRSVTELEAHTRRWTSEWNKHPGHSPEPRPPARSSAHSRPAVNE